MFLKVGLLFVFASLLLQCTQAYPQKDSSSSEENVDISPRNKLIFIALYNLSKLANFTLDNGKALLFKVVYDPELTNLNNDVVKANLTKFTEILEKIDNYTQNVNVSNEMVLKDIKLAIEFANVTNRYDPDDLSTLTADEKLIRASLIKSGIKEFETKFNQSYLALTNDFIGDVNNYLDKLSPSERIKQTKMYDWVKNVKTKKNRKEVFDKFFELYEDDSDEK